MKAFLRELITIGSMVVSIVLMPIVMPLLWLHRILFRGTRL